MEKIDFVLPWLDGDDPQWQSQKNEEKIKTGKELKEFDDRNKACRYRDMGLLKYWFRSVEKFAPWVNKIHFVTCGQKPDWLNENHPKMHLVNHKDYIPSKYLPTFNSNTIETNLHRIPSLSERFVLFNDDVFLLKSVTPDFFFHKNKPVLPANLKIYRLYGNDNWSKVCFNDYCTVNVNFNIKDSIWLNRKKWFSIESLGFKSALMNYIRYKVNKTFMINGYEHLANPHLKSTIQEVWDKCPNVLNDSSMFRFRSDLQVNHWLMIAWNLAKGRFYPIREGERGVCVSISTEFIYYIKGIIEKQKCFQVCINDSFENDNPDFCFKEIAKSFESILPEKSSFEK